MKAISIFRLTILFLIVMSTFAIAQENHWGTQDNSANFPRLSPNPPANRSRASRNVTPTAPPKTYAPPPPTTTFAPQFPCPPQPCKSLNSEISAYLGYLYKDHGAGLQIQFNGPTAANPITYTRNDFDLQGIWLEFAMPMAINENMSFLLSGAHLFPLQSTSVQSYSLAGAASSARQWTPDIQWWEVNAAGAYQFVPSVSGIMGFRWTYFGATFNYPVIQTGFVNPNLDSSTFTTNSFIPYSGILVEAKIDCRSVIKLAGYGCPILPGDFSYTEALSLNQGTTSISSKDLFSCGYFAEGLAEYSMRRDLWDMGGFVRFTVVHSERSVGATVGGVNTPVDVTFDRRNWVFGGKVGYAF